jgi:hypothetical protein
VEGSGSLDAQITGLVIEADGTYVIIASRFGLAAGDSTGGFYLKLIESADSGLGNSVATALAITPDTPVQGEISSERFAQYFRFEAQANDVVTVRMERMDGGLDSFLTLLDSAGNEVATNDDFDGSQNAQINDALIPATGMYTIRATRFQGEAGLTTGRYRLTLANEGSALEDIPQDTQFIPYGSTLTGNIDDTTPELLYAFFGTQGDVVTVSMNRGDGDLDPVVAIMDATQHVLTSNDDSSGSQNALIDKYTLPTTGVYLLRAGDPVQRRGQDEHARELYSGAGAAVRLGGVL